METEALIKALAADGGQRRAGLGLRLALSLVLALVLAAAVFGLALTPRADLLSAGPRVAAKLAVTLTLAVTMVLALPGAARPLARPPRFLWAAPGLLALAVSAEALALPPGSAFAALMGGHHLACLGIVTLLGLGPLAVFLGFLRSGAPASPVRAGALAGLASGGIAASFYALHCTDDSPFFVAVWYGLAVAGLGALGAALAPRIARW